MKKIIKPGPYINFTLNHSITDHSKAETSRPSGVKLREVVPLTPWGELLKDLDKFHCYTTPVIYFTSYSLLLGSSLFI